MVDTQEIKTILKSQMRQYFRSKWAVKLSERSGYSADYIRKYFKEEHTNPLIAETAHEMVDEAKRSEKQSLKKLQS